MNRPLFWAGMVLATARLGLACATLATTEAKKAEAESAYGAEQQLCVAEASTLAESRDCRARVDRKWDASPRPLIPADMFLQPATFIDGGPRDGGTSSLETIRAMDRIAEQMPSNGDPRDAGSDQ